MLTSKIHGYLDYITVLFFAIAPSIFSLSQTGTYLAYFLAVVHFLMTIFTAFSSGAIKLIPFQVHGYVELAVSLLLLAGPWLLADSFSSTDQIFFTVCGAAVLIVWLLTKYKSPLKNDF
ncbi:MAG TPA: hypothetical protein VF181_09070 [Balneolaceae bacterium]